MLIGLNAADGQAARLSFHTTNPYAPEGYSICDIIALCKMRYALLGVPTELTFEGGTEDDHRSITNKIEVLFTELLNSERSTN